MVIGLGISLFSSAVRGGDVVVSGGPPSEPVTETYWIRNEGFRLINNSEPLVQGNI